jgi:hypothetical protein
MLVVHVSASVAPTDKDTAVSVGHGGKPRLGSPPHRCGPLLPYSTEVTEVGNASAGG